MEPPIEGMSLWRAYMDEYRSAENCFGRSCSAGARPAVGGGENRTRPVSLQTIRFSEAAGCATSPVMHAAMPQATPAYVILGDRHEHTAFKATGRKRLSGRWKERTPFRWPPEEP